MVNPLDPLNAAQQDLVSFETGVSSTGVLNTVNGWRWSGNDPATYTITNESAHKWGGGAVGTPGTASYWFDIGSNWTPVEQTSFLSAMTLWSDLAGISFTQADSAADAQVVYYRYGSTTPPSDGLDTGAYATATYAAGAPGDTTVPATGSARIVIETTGKWSNLNDFTTYGGEGPATVVHELGHVLGLMHTGPYNSDVNVATQQLNQYDTQLWSVMSYIEPYTTGTKYQASYPVTGTDWGKTADDVDGQATTPMILDIAALQQLYGLPTQTAFTGGQVFGFNCNITDASRQYYDFTVNTQPVVTIWDPGANNVLDLSGFTTGCTINLNPGSFSSVGGLVNNLGIAFGTRIDRVVGSQGNDTYVATAAGETIEGGGGNDTVDLQGAAANYELSRDGGTVTAVNRSSNTTYRLSDVETIAFDDSSIATDTIPCFVEGTRIATPAGGTPVEMLAIGAEVLTATGETATVAWMGHRRVDCARHPDPLAVRPVRIRAHTFGPGQPARDLMLSPDHAVCVDGLLVPVRYLVTGDAIAFVPVARVTYWHLALARHDIVLAEGLPAETYLDTGDRAAFEGAEVIMLHPVFGGLQEEGRCMPLTVTGPALARLRMRIAAEERHRRRG
ncbi:MAG: Hint domain-containing protein [Rhodospirillales bacterium]|nr:Hint domain-containing protein [Rhodospirillales bacterium]